MDTKLAIQGGAPAVTLKYDEKWPPIGEEEIEAVLHAIHTPKLSISDGTGIIGEFERNFADYLGVKYAIAQNNGTSTLHAAYFAVGIGPGDEVIVPTYTWHATASPVLATNGIPVFCDIDPQTFCALPEDIERKITKRTKAIAVVHMWGHPADMDAIMAIARKHNLAVIEDCSHAHGATYKGRKVGTFGDVACFSLQGSKVMVGGEAGIAVTNNPDYHDRILALGHYGRLEKGFLTETYRALAYTGFGWKYRAHPLAIAIANVQLKKLDRTIQARRANLEYLTRALQEAEMDGIAPMYTAPDCTRGGWYGYRAQYYAERFGGLSKDRFIAALRAEGVDAETERYRLLHPEPLFNGFNLYGQDCPYNCPHVTTETRHYKPGDFPNAEAIFPRLISLPTFTFGDHRPIIDQYVAAFKKVTANVDQLM